ncbi:MAG TPA: hypothetical protein VLR89_08945, partial [Anaerolineaceae bacterium]|nr:hypothetical protein [Anaerolineaceae bacterium]
MTILAVNPDVGSQFSVSFFFHLAYLLLCFGLLAFDYKQRQFPSALRIALMVLAGLNLGVVMSFILWGSSSIFSLAIPPMDRLVSLLSLIWLIWALGHRKELKPFTQTVLGLNFALGIAAVAGFVLWLPQA